MISRVDCVPFHVIHLRVKSRSKVPYSVRDAASRETSFQEHLPKGREFGHVCVNVFSSLDPPPQLPQTPLHFVDYNALDRL